MSISTPVADNKMQADCHWTNGRLVAHASGSDAGNLRLDMELPSYTTAEEAAEHVQLVIPDETSPLSATGAVGEDGRFVLSFFSISIANSGQVPREAVVCWESSGGENRMRSVEVVSAVHAERDGGAEAVNVPGPTTTYPATVAMVALGGAVVASIIAIVMLLQSV